MTFSFLPTLVKQWAWFYRKDRSKVNININNGVER